MTTDHRVPNAITGAVICAVLFMAPVPLMGQVPSEADTDDAEAQAARAERIARRFERDARILTVFDRHGEFVTTVGERGIYTDVVFSPDRTRLVVRKVQLDLRSDTRDVWVFDIATGNSTRITSNGSRDEEWSRSAVWSPDGSQLAYVALRDGYEGVYRKASNGEGPEELLYRHPGADVFLGDWSMDGRYLSLSASDGFFEGVLYALPMNGNGEREAIEVFRSESQLLAGSFSPDARFLSYTSDESGKNEVYVRSFDPSADAASAARVWPVSDQDGRFGGRSAWRRNGRELYYVAADLSIVAAEVDTHSTLELGEPTVLFRPSQAIAVNPWQINVSRDGERVVIAVPHAPKLEQVTVFDRQGTVVHRLGEPGIYRNPTLSPDAQKVAVRRVDPESGNDDIWTFDLASGEGTAVTNDTWQDNWPVWSPDGSELAYVSRRDLYSSIYRKAGDGTGDEKQVFQYTPGAFLQLTDWSADGRFLTFQDGCWGILHVLPVGAAQDAGERAAIEWLRDEYQVAQARVSPDSRFIAYLSDEIEPEEYQIYVSPFDPSQPGGGRGITPPVRVFVDAVEGMVTWREDGEELYYLTPDWEVMAVDVTTTPTFQAGTPRRLFTLPGPLPGNTKQWKSVSPDGEHFVFVLNVPVSVP